MKFLLLWFGIGFLAVVPVCVFFKGAKGGDVDYGDYSDDDIYR